jgi:hypothetical protein
MRQKQLKTAVFTVRLTKQEVTALKRAAKAQSNTPSEFMRGLLERELSRPRKRGIHK